MLKVETLTSIISAISESIFQNSCAYHVANFLNFSKLPQLLQFGWVEAVIITKQQSALKIHGKIYGQFWVAINIAQDHKVYSHVLKFQAPSTLTVHCTTARSH